MSPVEFAISKANELVDMAKCGCDDCMAELGSIHPDSVMLAQLVRRTVRNHPAMCFMAMMDEWPMVEFVRVINDLDRPATVGCRDRLT